MYGKEKKLFVIGGKKWKNGLAIHIFMVKVSTSPLQFVSILPAQMFSKSAKVKPTIREKKSLGQQAFGSEGSSCRQIILTAVVESIVPFR